MSPIVAWVLVGCVIVIGGVLIVVRRAGLGAPKTQQAPDQVAK